MHPIVKSYGPNSSELGAVYWQPTGPIGANGALYWSQLGAVCWQPTGLTGNYCSKLGAAISPRKSPVDPRHSHASLICFFLTSPVFSGVTSCSQSLAELLKLRACQVYASVESMKAWFEHDLCGFAMEPSNKSMSQRIPILLPLGDWTGLRVGSLNCDRNESWPLKTWWESTTPTITLVTYFNQNTVFSHRCRSSKTLFRLFADESDNVCTRPFRMALVYLVQG